MKTTQTGNLGKRVVKEWKTACRIGVMAALIGALTSCGTPAPRPAAGRAILDATPGGKHEDRLKGMRIVAVNGRSASHGKAHIGPGYNNVRVRFGWPQGGSQEVSLKFNARQDRRYFVKYAPFPPTHDQFRGTTEVGSAANRIGETAYALTGSYNPVANAAGVVVYSPAIVLGIADKSYRVKETIRERNEPVHYVDVSVISEHHAEGVVRRVRAYPSGRVVSKPWDPYSNAPSGGTREASTVFESGTTGDGIDDFRHGSQR